MLRRIRTNAIGDMQRVPLCNTVAISLPACSINREAEHAFFLLSFFFFNTNDCRRSSDCESLDLLICAKINATREKQTAKCSKKKEDSKHLASSILFFFYFFSQDWMTPGRILMMIIHSWIKIWRHIYYISASRAGSRAF